MHIILYIVLSYYRIMYNKEKQKRKIFILNLSFLNYNWKASYFYYILQL